MATVIEMLPAVGSRAMVQFEDVAVECDVIDAKSAWGKTRLLVEPVSGNGSQWVEMQRVKPCGEHLGLEMVR